VPSNNLLA